MTKPSPVLLTTADWAGTLAAIRCFGRRGIPATVADSTLLAPAMWSRYVSRRELTPARESEGYLEWYLDFGARNPGHILYPTDDDTAWLFSLHRDILSKRYKMYSPPFEAIRRVLNKQSLHEICQDLRIDTPETFCPSNEADLEHLARRISYPVIIKPKLQVFLLSRVKGALVSNQEDLLKSYSSFLSSSTFAPAIGAQDPALGWPLVQAYYPETIESIYGLSGFIDETGELLAFRAARKVLQLPRRIGIGLCFEEAEIDEALRQKVVSLCRRAGYYGVFEVEFAEANDGRRLLLDFNPRFYNQMAFDIARGMPLPEFVYHAATENHVQLAEVVAECGRSTGDGSRVYCYGLEFTLMLILQRLCGSMHPNELRRWRLWFREHRRHMTDRIRDANDPIPAFVNSVLLGKYILKNPRRFVQSIGLST